MDGGMIDHTIWEEREMMSTFDDQALRYREGMAEAGYGPRIRILEPLCAEMTRQAREEREPKRLLIWWHLFSLVKNELRTAALRAVDVLNAQAATEMGAPDFTLEETLHAGETAQAADALIQADLARRRQGGAQLSDD
jgi:hypothetical protein